MSSIDDLAAVDTRREHLLGILGHQLMGGTADGLISATGTAMEQEMNGHDRRCAGAGQRRCA